MRGLDDARADRAGNEYECLGCGRRLKRSSTPVECPSCGSPVRNLSAPLGE